MAQEKAPRDAGVYRKPALAQKDLRRRRRTGVAPVSIFIPKKGGSRAKNAKAAKAVKGGESQCIPNGLSALKQFQRAERRPPVRRDPALALDKFEPGRRPALRLQGTNWLRSFAAFASFARLAFE